MSSSSNNGGGGIGLCGATFLVFLVLKLTGHIDWSWWWVTAPLWGSFVILGLFVFVMIMMSLIFEPRRKRRGW